MSRLDAEIQNVRDMVLKMGGCVEKGLEATREAILRRKPNLIEEVRKQEKEINALQMKVDEVCVQLLAQQSPVAKDLRFVISVTKMNTDLERMGDQTLNTARYGLEFLEAQSSMEIPTDLEKMFGIVIQMVRQSLDAFSRKDIEASKAVLEQDDEVDLLKRKLFDLAKAKMESQEWSIDSGLQFVMIAKNLERLADHVTNVAEDVIFLATGEDIRHGQGQVLKSKE